MNGLYIVYADTLFSKFVSHFYLLILLYASILTGQSLHIFKLVSGEPTSLAILSDDVFWTKKNSLDVYWTPKHSPDTTKQLILPHHDFVTKEDDLVLVAVSPILVVNHPCMFNNGNCSHICTTYGEVQKICLCPPGMVFRNSQNTTCMEAVDCEFRYNHHQKR